MADRIKGITVEIGGNTTGLNKALADTNSELRNAQSQLKDVQRLLKLDPNNTELLVQKQKLLATAVGETKTKLDTLKIAEKQVQQQFTEGKISQQQYSSLQREIVETEQSLRSLEKQANNSDVALSKIKSTAGGVANTASSVSQKTAGATVAIVGLGAVAFASASDLEESQNKVDVAFKESADSVKLFAETSLENYGIAKGAALDAASTFGDMGTSMGLQSDTAAQMATSLTGLAGDLSSFKNIGVDQAMTALNGVFTGETESLKTLGIIMTQTELDAYALANGYSKTTKEMTSAEKVQLRYAYLMNVTKNAQGEYARTADGAANSIRTMQGSAQELSAEFGEQLLPIITPLIQKVTQMIQFFGNLDEKTKSNIVTIMLLVAAISPIAGIISGIASMISFLIPIIGMLSANPFFLIIAAVVAVGVAIDNLWNTNETFRIAIIETWEAIVETGEWWTGTIGGFIDGVIAKVQVGIDWLNKLFSMDGVGSNDTANSIWKYGNIPGFANGGSISSGLAFVGENGPELLSVSGGLATVTPLNNSSNVYNSRSIGGTVINLQPTFYGYKQSDGAALVRDLNRQLGRLLK